MAVIIGAGSTVVTSLFPQGGIVSVNFGISPTVTRLWELGSFDPYDTITQNQRSLSITAYGKDQNNQGGSQIISLTPSTSCIDAGTISVTINPGVCGTAVSPFTDDFFVTSYSYSKDDPKGHGQESWSFTSKPIIPSYTGTIVMLRGISTGQHLTGNGVMTTADMGVVVNEAASKDSLGNWIEGESGSVSAGFPGIGNYDVTREVVYSQIGGSLLKDDGNRGTAQVQSPINPIFI
jgi:hypothetical protein